jgi:hypothetical protein
LFVADRCRYFLETVPTLPRDPKNADDTDPAAPDHALDALEYGIAGSATGHAAMGDFTKRPARVIDTGERVVHV